MMVMVLDRERPVEGPGRLQVSLADLSVLVLAAGLAAGVVRGAKDIGAMPERMAGVGVEIVAVCFALLLGRSIVGLARRPAGAGVTRVGRLASMAWRVLAILLLLQFVIQESGVLRVDMATRNALRSETTGWYERYTLREVLVPVCAILAMFGVAVGMGAGTALARPEPRRPRPSWLFVPLAAIAGMLIVALPNMYNFIPCILLVAMEGVNNALPPGSRYTTASLSVRMLRAGIVAVPAALAITGLAMIVARDFGRAGRSLPWATTRLGWSVRLIALALALVAGTAMAIVGIPMMSPLWLDGFGQVLDPEVVMTILAGFGTLAVGLAARAVVPRPASERPRWLRRLSFVLPIGMMGIVLLSVLTCLPSATEIDPELPPIVGRLLAGVGEVHGRVWDVLPDPLVIVLQESLAPNHVVWILSAAGLAVFLVELAMRPPGLRTTPFDLVAGEPGRLVRFIWLSAALIVVCVAAVPTLIVVGQVILHIRLGISTWTVRGWPSPF
jgi:hypothetical protein